MKLIASIISLVFASLAIVAPTSVAAWEESGFNVQQYKIYKINDIGIKMGHEQGEHLMWLEVDEEPTWQMNDTTFWEVVNFDRGVAVDWKVGDTIKIYYGADHFYATNINKPNTMLVLRPY